MLVDNSHLLLTMPRRPGQVIGFRRTFGSFTSKTTRATPHHSRRSPVDGTEDTNSLFLLTGQVCGQLTEAD